MRHVLSLRCYLLLELEEGGCEFGIRPNLHFHPPILECGGLWLSLLGACDFDLHSQLLRSLDAMALTLLDCGLAQDAKGLLDEALQIVERLEPTLFGLETSTV